MHGATGAAVMKTIISLLFLLLLLLVVGVASRLYRNPPLGGVGESVESMGERFGDRRRPQPRRRCSCKNSSLHPLAAQHDSILRSHFAFCKDERGGVVALHATRVQIVMPRTVLRLIIRELRTLSHPNPEGAGASKVSTLYGFLVCKKKLIIPPKQREKEKKKKRSRRKNRRQRKGEFGAGFQTSFQLPHRVSTVAARHGRPIQRWRTPRAKGFSRRSQEEGRSESGRRGK